MTGLIDALAAVGAMCLFCTAALLVILLTGDGELEPQPAVDPRDAEILRLQRRVTVLANNWDQTRRQRDFLADECQELNQALTEQVYRDQCKQAHPASGRTLDPRNLIAWHGEN